jgi:hypothetical protein
MILLEVPCMILLEVPCPHFVHDFRPRAFVEKSCKSLI